VRANFNSCYSYLILLQNPADDKDKKEKASSSPAPLKDLEGNSNGGQMMLPNGLSEDDKAFKYGSSLAAACVFGH
jgi:hypothetical protein